MPKEYLVPFSQIGDGLALMLPPSAGFDVVVSV